ncbi:MAG: hypothetical protein WDO71_09170 [Bacteroidota bacterium]
MADFQKAWSLSKHEKYAFEVTNVWIDKKPDSAVVFLHSALKELPESFLLRLSLARAYNGLNKTDNVLKFAKKYCSPYLISPMFYCYSLNCWEKKGDTQGAITALEKAYRLVPLNMDLAFRLAYQYAGN